MGYDVQRMVVEVNKLITNELIAEGGVYLPGIGSLAVEQGGAAAHREVVFSDAERFTSLVAVIAMRTRCSAEQAAKLYEQWSEAVHKSLQVEIDGVGVVRGGRFEVSPIIDQRLNPVVVEPKVESVAAAKAAAERPKFAVALAILVAVVIGVFAVQWVMNREEPDSVPMVELVPSTPVDTAVEAPVAEPVVEAVTELQVIEVLDEESAPKLLTVRKAKLMNNNEAVAVFESVLKQSGDRDATKYKVVYGVYNSKANAGRAIVNARELTADDETIFGALLRDGKYVVTLFESDHFFTSVSYMKRNRERMGDTLWVYDPDKM